MKAFIIVAEIKITENTKKIKIKHTKKTKNIKHTKKGSTGFGLDLFLATHHHGHLYFVVFTRINGFCLAVFYTASHLIHYFLT